MRRPTAIPEILQGRAFSRDEALVAGVTPRMLQHPRFEQIFPSVYRVTGTRLDDRGLIAAAALALPPDARVSHLTRLRLVGLDFGPLEPLHFTVARDLHLDIPAIFLHRTIAMPLADLQGVSIPAAFIGAAATRRLIDLVKIGDWLLHRHHLSIESLLGSIHAEPWRPGAGVALAIVRYLDPASRSLKESATRVVLEFSGLPRPEVNQDVRDANGHFLACADLLYRLWRLVIEYEGRQHAADAAQFAHDIDRYAGLRRHDWEYVQVTNAKLNQPRALVLSVHQRLVERGYDGPAPVFGRHWRSLFAQPGPVTLVPRAVDSQRCGRAFG
jgi:hypothetical protein